MSAEPLTLVTHALAHTNPPTHPSRLQYTQPFPHTHKHAHTEAVTITQTTRVRTQKKNNEPWECKKKQTVSG